MASRPYFFSVSPECVDGRNQGEGRGSEGDLVKGLDRDRLPYELCNRLYSGIVDTAIGEGKGCFDKPVERNIVSVFSPPGPLKKMVLWFPVFVLF